MFRFSLFLIFLICQNLFFSQSIKHFHIPDSLKNKNYEQLQNAYDKVFRIDNNKAEIFANTILSKGKKEKNRDLIYDGYYKIAHIKGLKSENGHPYADTLLSITQNVDTKDYPAKAHIIKGILYNYDWKYNKALDQYIEAQKSSKNKNPDQFYYIKKLIGILKTATDENEEALPLFLEYYNYQKQKVNTEKKDIKSYIGSVFSVSNAYSKTKNYQKSKQYNKIGISECKKHNDYSHYAYFLMSEGIADYYLKNYNIATENLLVVEKKLLKNEDHPNLAIVYYFLAKINTETKNEKKAVNYFIKSDSLSFVSNEFLPVTRDGYEILIDYYKNKGDKENQLKYINKLFHADSIINNSKQYLSKEIYKKYDTPILLEEKEKLISDLNNKNSILYWFLGIGFFTISILLFMFIKNKKRVKEYKKQAEILLSKSTKEFEFVHEVTTNSDDWINKNYPPQEKPKNTVPHNILTELKLQLELFETKKEFLHKNITIDGLAKEFGTNRDYLSKSVNEIKEQNFSQYLNELRINYVVKELKSNEKLRKYTISAIASEIGYNNSESFSNAFKKITGTLPSFYIKLLNQETNIL
ncbi:helix-turn-helix transcriptional regulator [Chryseobacterium sp. PBS4-4]|uniref:Helix-turn-helix transcriptional regulator n=1 Tax=Chryseobacterium edaphi TaxID=2976532 RepID=A0ABT2W5C0_9FLAO|nr:response regulator transcription factor [Chryseobacterium edaphi]MCU7617407.1 helix-turn-helix transcriptional regulator [Chryseobacterium edaphi]